MEDAGWTLTLFLSRQLVGVLGSGDTCRRQLLCLHVPGTGCASHTGREQSPASSYTRYGPQATYAGEFNRPGPAPCGSGSIGPPSKRLCLALPPERIEALGPPQARSKGLAGGPASTLTYGRGSQGLDPHALEGEAGRERCRPERLSIAWMDREGGTGPGGVSVGFPGFWFLLWLSDICSTAGYDSTVGQVCQEQMCGFREEYPPGPTGEPSPPWSPSPLGPKGEGEKKQRQRWALMRQPLPLVWYWGGEGIAHPSPDSSRGIGMTGEKVAVSDGGARWVGKAWATGRSPLRGGDWTPRTTTSLDSPRLLGNDEGERGRIHAIGAFSTRSRSGMTGRDGVGGYAIIGGTGGDHFPQARSSFPAFQAMT